LKRCNTIFYSGDFLRKKQKQPSNDKISKSRE